MVGHNFCCKSADMRDFMVLTCRVPMTKCKMQQWCVTQEVSGRAAAPPERDTPTTTRQVGDRP